ncbi:MAG: hypothetical protein Q7U47_04970 [Paludibacter sp.]|nr:hypothetical protein [Paludibacter sp.]
MKNKLITYCLSSFLVSSVFLSSCMNDVDLANISSDVKIDQSLVLPLGEINLTLKDMLNQLETEMINTSGNEINILMFDTLGYELGNINLLQGFVPLTKVYLFNLEEIKQVLINNGNSLGSLIEDFPIAVPGGLDFIIPALKDTLELGLDTDPNVDRIDSVKLSKLTMSLNVNVENFALNPTGLRFSLKLNNVFVKKGNLFTPLDTTVQLVNYNTPVSITLTNVLIKPDPSNGNIPIDIDLKIKSGAAGITIYNNSKINYEFTLTKLDFDVAYGKFKPQLQTNHVNSIPFDFDMDGLRLKFVNPQISVSMKTNLGFRIKFIIDFIRAISKDNTTKYAEFNGLQSTSYTTKRKPAFPGAYVIDTIPVFDQNNGSTYKLFESNAFPEKLEYKYSIESAPDPALKPDFITNQTKAEVYLKVKVPLHLNAGSKLEFTQTIKDIDQSLKTIFEEESINKDFLILRVKNGLPLHAKLKMNFLDSVAAPITTTFVKEYDLVAPVVNSSGVVTTIKEQILKIEINKTQIKEIKKTKNIDFDITIDGIDANGVERPINLQLSNSFGVKLGVFVQGNKIVSLSSTN